MNKIVQTIVVLIITFNISCSQDNEVIKTIKNRKSVRHFTGESVSKEDLDKILKCAMCAPTAMNKQPWSFIVISEKKNIETLADSLHNSEMYRKAGAIIIVCAIPEKTIEGRTEFAIIDCSLAGENILLAVESLGLGAVWTAAYPDERRMNLLRNLLGIPGNVIPVNIIPIGHPTGEDKPKDKFKEDNIHREKW